MFTPNLLCQQQTELRENVPFFSCIAFSRMSNAPRYAIRGRWFWRSFEGKLYLSFIFDLIIEKCIREKESEWNKYYQYSREGINSSAPNYANAYVQMSYQ